jgi:hypothetical protein
MSKDGSGGILDGGWSLRKRKTTRRKSVVCKILFSRDDGDAGTRKGLLQRQVVSMGSLL